MDDVEVVEEDGFEASEDDDVECVEEEDFEVLEDDDLIEVDVVLVEVDVLVKVDVLIEVEDFVEVDIFVEVDGLVEVDDLVEIDVEVDVLWDVLVEAGFAFETPGVYVTYVVSYTTLYSVTTPRSSCWWWSSKGLARTPTAKAAEMIAERIF